jgi:hypothetical protein
MEQQNATTSLPVTTRAAGVRFGLISAVFSIIYFIVMMMAGVDMQGPAGWVGWIVAAVLIFLAHKYYKDNGNGYMSYSQGISIAFWMGLVSAAISNVFTYIYVKFVDESFLTMIKDKQIEKMQEKGMSDDQIDQAMKFTEMFMKPEAVVIMGFIMGVISAVLIALIVTLFTQKKNPDLGTLDA